jgi:hypothetical protein
VTWPGYWLKTADSPRMALLSTSVTASAAQMTVTVAD